MGGAPEMPQDPHPPRSPPLPAHLPSRAYGRALPSCALSPFDQCSGPAASGPRILTHASGTGAGAARTRSGCEGDRRFITRSRKRTWCPTVSGHYLGVLDRIRFRQFVQPGRLHRASHYSNCSDTRAVVPSTREPNHDPPYPPPFSGLSSRSPLQQMLRRTARRASPAATAVS